MHRLVLIIKFKQKIMKIKNLFVLFSTLIYLGVVSTSCGDSEPTCSEAAFNEDLNNETEQINEALTAFSLDPTNPSVCNDYIDALENFVDELERYRSCAEELGELADFNEGLNEARQSIDDTICP